MSVDLCYLSATESLALFNARKLSPVELLKAQIQRAEDVNRRVNAIVMDYFDAALTEAKRAEKAYSNGCARPLEGLPVAVKDEHNIVGTRTTNGSLLLRENVATYTDPICERLIAAGAIIHRPLARVPENTLKFGVGVMLSAFGVFWTGEGLGIPWPGEDLALLLFAALFLGAGLLASTFARKLAVAFA